MSNAYQDSLAPRRAGAIECLPGTLTDVVIHTTVGGGTPIDMRKYRGGRIIITSGAPTSLTFYEAVYGADETAPAAASHVLAMDVTAVTCEVSKSVEIPPALFGCESIVIVGNVAGVATVTRKS